MRNRLITHFPTIVAREACVRRKGWRSLLILGSISIWRTTSFQNKIAQS